MPQQDNRQNSIKFLGQAQVILGSCAQTQAKGQTLILRKSNLYGEAHSLPLPSFFPRAGVAEPWQMLNVPIAWTLFDELDATD